MGTARFEANKPLSLLFVDDDEIFLKVLSRYFLIQHPNYQVKTCKNSTECLALLSSFQPDLLVLDYHLQRKESPLQGAELLKAIRATGSKAKIVVLSGREREEMLPKLLEQHVEDYIVKDMNALPELENVLEKYFG